MLRHLPPRDSRKQVSLTADTEVKNRLSRFHLASHNSRAKTQQCRSWKSPDAMTSLSPFSARSATGDPGTELRTRIALSKAHLLLVGSDAESVRDLLFAVRVWRS